MLMQRPTSVTVLGILNLVFAASGLCCGFAGAAGLIFLQNLDLGDARVPLSLRLMQENEMFRICNFASVGLGIVSSLLLIISGIGLLKLRSWGRLLAIFNAVYSIIISIFAFVVSIMVYSPAFEAAQQAADTQDTAEALQGMISGGVTCGLGLIYPIVVLGFMLFRQSVREAFGVGGNQSDMMEISDDNTYSDPMS
jgi:hypothetical protein